MRAYTQYGLLGLCLLFGFLAVPVLTLASPSAQFGGPVPDGPVLVVAPPWSDIDEMIVRSGGQVIGPRRAAFGQYGAFPDAGFSERLKSNGAWFVLNGATSSLFCGGAL
ncbi:hypothetical protein N4R57_00990 [Rhodobacteraceae bacterium D3-12]|nr:hypothetical protein N4R57_00990 [Rhodobacteraceae bacterium D3-12]